MDHHRQLRGARLLKLAPKDLLLHVARRMIVVIVEAHFAPGDHARIAAELVELREMLIGGGTRIVRMDANRRVDPIVLLGEGNRGIEAFLGPVPLPMASRASDARRARAIEHRVAVFVELRELRGAHVSR